MLSLVSVSSTLKHLTDKAMGREREREQMVTPEPIIRYARVRRQYYKELYL